MMKPQHLDEASNIVRAIKEYDEQIADLNICTTITTKFVGRNLLIPNTSPMFINVRNGIIAMCEQNIAALIRRANQISLSIPNRDMIQKA